MKLLAGLDFPIVILVLLLCGFGWAIIASVAGHLLVSQMAFYLFGFCLLIVFSHIDIRAIGSLFKLIYVLAVVLLVATLVFGLESRGATRWIALGSFRLQFSELLKPFFVAALAGLFCATVRFRFTQFMVLVGWMAIPVFLIFRQPDLGSAAVYALTFLSMVFVSGVPLRYLLAFGVPVLVLAPSGWHFLAPYQRDRVMSFLRVGFDPLGKGYNAIQSLITVGSGMLLGRGLGRGTQAQLFFLPERHTDFVFASIAEEMGFLGAGILLAIYFLLLWRILHIGFLAKASLERSVCVGVGGLLLGQVFINVGMNLGILPVTGITLPLVSYGGSSVVATFIGLGMVASISRRIKPSSFVVA